MSKRIALAALAVLAAASVLVANAVGQSPEGRTIVLAQIQQGAAFQFVDNPPRTTINRGGEPRRVSAGDAISFSFPLVDAQRARAGVLSGQCAVTKPGTASRTLYTCTGGFLLKDGQITTTFVVRDLFSALTGAVTGGTGAYTGARGTVRVDDQQRDTIELLP